MGFDACLPKLALCVAFVGMGVWGCGGSSSGAPAHGVESQSVADFTAVMKVNVYSGVVTFTPSSATKTSRTVFTGPTITMSSTTLVNQAGTPGVKSTLVTLTNNSGSPIGVDPNGNAIGVRVLFGTFTITGGSSSDAVELSNPTSFTPSANGGSGTNVAYIVYPAAIAPNKASPSQNWNFIVPSGVTAFSVPVTIEADNSYSAPPNGASGIGSANVYVRTIAGGNLLDFSNGSATQARFNDLTGLAVDRAGNIYASDALNSCIRRITPSGSVTTIAGSPFLGQGFTNGVGNVATFNLPFGVAVTPDGSTVYVADAQNNAIRRIVLFGNDPTNPSNWRVSTIAGNGTAGGNYFPSTVGSSATLNEPFGIALDQAGNLAITEERGNRVRRIQFIGGDPSSAANWEVSLLGGDTSAVFGKTGDGDGNRGTSTFNAPDGIAVDAAGNFYLTELNNHRVRKVTSDGFSSTLAGGTSGSTVTAGYVDGNGASAEFREPEGIAVDSSSLVYVTDSSNNRIREITPAGNVTTIAGTSNNFDIDGPGSTASFSAPAGIAVSSSGNLYVGNLAYVRLIERINSQ